MPRHPIELDHTPFLDKLNNAKPDKLHAQRKRRLELIIRMEVEVPLETYNQITEKKTMSKSQIVRNLKGIGSIRVIKNGEKMTEKDRASRNIR